VTTLPPGTPCGHLQVSTCNWCQRLYCYACDADPSYGVPVAGEMRESFAFHLDIAKACKRCNPPCPDDQCHIGHVHKGLHRAEGRTEAGLVFWDAEIRWPPRDYGWAEGAGKTRSGCAFTFGVDLDRPIVSPYRVKQRTARRVRMARKKRRGYA
jgi:hypothetical protein